MTGEALEALVHSVFGEHSAEAIALLLTYGSEQHEREADRVRRAVVQLADGDLGRLRYFTAVAKQDYRDVLMWAEYPAASKDVTLADVRALLDKWGQQPDRKPPPLTPET